MQILWLFSWIPIIKCECDIRNSEINIKEIKKFTEKTLYESFYDTLKFSNYKVLKCYNLAFNINSMTMNKGGIVAIIYFSFYFLTLIIFLFNGINQLKIDISKRMDHLKSQINNGIINAEVNSNKMRKSNFFQNLY